MKTCSASSHSILTINYCTQTKCTSRSWRQSTLIFQRAFDCTHKNIRSIPPHCKRLTQMCEPFVRSCVLVTLAFRSLITLSRNESYNSSYNAWIGCVIIRFTSWITVLNAISASSIAKIFMSCCANCAVFCR